MKSPCPNPMNWIGTRPYFIRLRLALISHLCPLTKHAILPADCVWCFAHRAGSPLASLSRRPPPPPHPPSAAAAPAATALAVAMTAHPCLERGLHCTPEPSSIAYRSSSSRRSSRRNESRPKGGYDCSMHSTHRHACSQQVLNILDS